jgi:hypothetical protein
MKKRSRLQLKRVTLRDLQDAPLADLAGGNPSVDEGSCPFGPCQTINAGSCNTCTMCPGECDSYPVTGCNTYCGTCDVTCGNTCTCFPSCGVCPSENQQTCGPGFCNPQTQYAEDTCMAGCSY